MEWSVPPIGERPHQPITFHFPQREFGQKTVTKLTLIHSKPNPVLLMKLIKISEANLYNRVAM